mmetsp:Transcript_84230/g.234990  ORF Transcript_84230/g.234990 Transcript_84230/m.234990 type:complete len:158 (+) Transcript_84230:174-647(+)
MGAAVAATCRTFANLGNSIGSLGTVPVLLRGDVPPLLGGTCNPMVTPALSATPDCNVGDEIDVEKLPWACRAGDTVREGDALPDGDARPERGDVDAPTCNVGVEPEAASTRPAWTIGVLWVVRLACNVGVDPDVDNECVDTERVELVKGTPAPVGHA